MNTIDQTELSNGLRVVLLPDSSSPVVGVAVHYDVGSRNEQPGLSGFAHLFEHMMFEGSQNVGKTEHFRLVSAFGGQLNGTTSQDRTNYYESLPSHQLALGLWLEADRMRALAVTEENFENQRQTVMEERRQRVDNAPYGQAFVELGEMSYGCWAYSHPVIGYWDDLEGAKFEDVQAFHQLWYRPDNAVLSVAGDFDPKEAHALINQYYGDIARGGPRPVPDLHEPVRTAATFEERTDPLAKLPALFINHQAPGYGHADFFVYEAIEALLFRGTSSRLYRRIVLEDQSAIQVSGGYECHRGPSLFGMFGVGAKDAELDLIRDAYLEELHRLTQEPVTTPELEKTLNQLRASHIFQQENPLNRSLSAGRNLLYHGDPQWEERYIEQIARVSAEDILRVANTFDPNRRVELRVHPA